MKYYVSMVDKFLSGWGQAKGLINIYLIECDTLEQAEQIKAHALDRKEMVRVKLSEGKPPVFNKRNNWISRKHYNDLGGVWHGQ